MAIDPLSLAITVALNAASMALQMTQKIEGPRLTDLTVSIADYGTPFTYFYGKVRLEAPCIYAEEIQERKKRRKTKGGKYNEYTYFGTWASVISAHQIAAVTRVWFDRHLVYDSTGTGVRSIFDISKNYELSSSMRVYLGTETQDPDPRMQATIEADEGVGMCPALLGIAYIFFEDVPLEKLGNRLPQVSIEAVTNSTDDFPYEYVDTQIDHPFQLRGMGFSSDYNRLFFGTLGQVEVYDAATRELLSTGTLPTNVDGLAQTFGVDSSGRFYAVEGSILLGGENWVHTFSSDGLQLLNSVEMPSYIGGFMGCQVLMDSEGDEFCFVPPYGNIYDHFFYFGIDTGSVVEINPPWAATMGFADEDGNLWACGTPYTGGGGSGSLGGFYCWAGPRNGDSGSCTMPTTHSGTGQLYALDNGAGQFFCAHNGGIFLVDKETFAVTATASHSTSALDINRFASWQLGAQTIWMGTDEIDVTTLETVRTIDLTDWQTDAFNSGTMFDPVGYAMMSMPGVAGPERIYWNFLERIDSDGVPLSDIYDNVSERAGQDMNYIDTTALTPIVRGYKWSQGAGSSILEPLDAIYMVVPRPHNWGTQFLLKGSVPSGTISSEFAVRETAEQQAWEIRLTNDTDTPRRIFLNYSDVNNDHQVGTATYARDPDTMDSNRDLSIDMTNWVTDADTAQQFVERMVREKWFKDREVEMPMTMIDFAYEPGDVGNLVLDGEIAMSGLLRSLRVGANGVLNQVWDRYHEDIYTLSGAVGAGMAGRSPSRILVPSLTRGWALDIPLLFSTQDSVSPFLYIGAAPLTPAAAYWPGADYEQSDSGEPDSFAAGWDGIAPSDAVTWGLALTALGDAEASVFDNGNTVNMQVKHGEFESATFDELMLNRELNLAIIGNETDGWELVQFQNAFLESDGSVTLQGFVRGVQGTETLTGNHKAGDSVILASSLLKRHFMSTDEIGDTDYYRPYTVGRESGDTHAVEFTANPLRPLSPVHGELRVGVSSGDDQDWTITAIRRTRVGGSRVDGEDVPLGETSGLFKAEVMDGVDVVRTLSSTVEFEFTYTVAEQLEDFGSPQSDLSVRLYQVSPTHGIEGHVLGVAS